MRVLSEAADVRPRPREVDMHVTTHIQALEGRDVFDRDGEEIGSIDEVYVDGATGAPESALVKGGLFGTKGHFVPLNEASPLGKRVDVPYDEDTVSNAPSLDPDGHLSSSEESELRRCCGMRRSERTSEPGSAQPARGATGDEAMTRSEEELQPTSNRSPRIGRPARPPSRRARLAPFRAEHADTDGSRDMATETGEGRSE